MVCFITSNTPFHHFKKSFRMTYLFKQLNLSTLYVVSIFLQKKGSRLQRTTLTYTDVYRHRLSKPGVTGLQNL